METSELLKKVRKIEIKIKGLSKHLFSGEYHSAFKGRGMSFSEVRSYQHGDDVRNIDWSVTARTNEPHVKVFEEERELTVILMVDMSKSVWFGTHGATKKEIITELSATLAFSAVQNNDKVGLLFFSNKIEKYIPPQKGRQHILRIIRELIEVEPTSSGTSITGALEYLNSLIKRRATVFLISDFLGKDYANALSIAAKKYDIIGIKVNDIHEEKLPNVGLINVVDAETGKEVFVDTGDKKFIEMYEKQMSEYRSYYEDAFRKSKSDTFKVVTNASYIQSLLQFFRQRSH